MSCRRPYQDRRMTLQRGRSAWTTRWPSWSTRRSVSRTWSSCRIMEPTHGRPTTSAYSLQIQSAQCWCLWGNTANTCRVWFFFFLQQLGLHDRDGTKGTSQIQVSLLPQTFCSKTRCLMCFNIYLLVCLFCHTGSKFRIWTGSVRMISWQQEPNSESWSLSMLLEEFTFVSFTHRSFPSVLTSVFVPSTAGCHSSVRTMRSSGQSFSWKTKSLNSGNSRETKTRRTSDRTFRSYWSRGRIPSWLVRLTGLRSNLRTEVFLPRSKCAHESQFAAHSLPLYTLFQCKNPTQYIIFSQTESRAFVASRGLVGQADEISHVTLFSLLAVSANDIIALAFSVLSHELISEVYIDLILQALFQLNSVFGKMYIVCCLKPDSSLWAPAWLQLM